jgi:opacity protein-like surface antigen
MKILVLLLGIWPIAAWWRGYVASVLWAWFVVPIFPLLPFVSAYQAAGVGLVISLFSHWPSDDKDGDDDDWKQTITAIIGMAFIPAFLLGLGAFWRWLQWGL